VNTGGRVCVQWGVVSTRDDIESRARRLVERMGEDQIGRLAEVDPALVALAVPEDEGWTPQDLAALRATIVRLCRERLRRAV